MASTAENVMAQAVAIVACSFRLGPGNGLVVKFVEQSFENVVGRVSIQEVFVDDSKRQMVIKLQVLVAQLPSSVSRYH